MQWRTDVTTQRLTGGPQVDRPIGGADRSHMLAGQPVGPPCQPPVAMLVLHRLLDYIYAIYICRFDPRVQDASWGLYIPACTPPLGGDAFDPKSLRARNPNPYFHQDQSYQSREDQSFIGSSLVLEIERQSEREEFGGVSTYQFSLYDLYPSRIKFFLSLLLRFLQ